ncbi:hypothetical protein AB5J49_26785 [Streptomyces sp. R28]|uniref:Butirosin biosynthesis protein H N-terminal domain-containing protein n=1 Tax=Streptomyces sp. R28 TaxID=3238628 RepID=A0AB39Q325_9ACTN
MKDIPYPYDRTLYSRLFLNCYQRESLVMLAERGHPVHQLLFRCLVSTDEILRQVIREQRPKYSFDSDLLDPDDLARIGIVKEEAEFDSYADARGLLLDVVAQEGYAILVGDVFYWPHCPEYRTRHLVHSIVLTGHDADTARWHVVDDNPASLLCSYTYPEDVIAAAFDNNELRRVRYYTTKDFDPAQAERGTREAFAALLDRYQDSHALQTGVADLLSCRWIAPERAIASLHDAFSLYQGSRIGLREYLRHTAGDAAVQELLDRIVRGSAEVMDQLLLAKVTGAVDARWTAEASLGLQRAEQELLPRLRAVAGAGGRA